MSYQIRDIHLLRKILWVDCLLGISNGSLGLLLSRTLMGFFGLPMDLILIVSAITLVYGLFALFLARQNPLSPMLVRVLVYGNWIWTVVSIVLLVLHFNEATIFGKIFLILQVVVVGLLAFLEGRQLYSVKPDIH